ncbi:MAG: hypothetical protein HZA94_01240 [Candidatus Vogelbacteria bacterium]|nr:hypothetical protein [Candidatus Vogelbacteria bacterium]
MGDSKILVFCLVRCWLAIDFALSQGLCYSDWVKGIAVLYHADCPDGFAAAYSAWKKFGDTAEYIPVHNNTKPPEEIYGKDVYTLDYSYPMETVKEILPQVKSLFIIDHHVSNIPAVKLAGGIMDIKHSGATLSWNYFFSDKKAPRLFYNIEDVDIWQFKLPFTNELSEITTLYPMDFKVWDQMIEEIETDVGLNKYVEEGRILIKKREDQIRKIAEYVEIIEFEGYKCYLVNSPVYVSYLGNFLCKKMPPFSIVWSRRGDKILVGLRGDGSVDVSKIAERYGGGGHHNAAGFSWEEKDFLKFKKSV